MRIPATLSILALFTAAACSSGSKDDPDAGVEPIVDGGPSGALARCGMAGKAELRSLQVASDGGTCDTWPTSGEHLLLEDSEAGPVLHAGAYRIPLIAGEGCRFTADSCALKVPDGGNAQFDRLALTLQGTPGKITLQWSSERVIGHTRETCATSGLFEAVAVDEGACEWAGAFRLAGEPTLVDGTCDAPWTWEPLTFQTSGEEPGLEVGGNFFDAIGPIENTCTVRASKGGFGFPDGGSDFWFYNDTLRWAELEATVGGDALTLRVTDRFAGPAEQVTCPGGTFEVHYARVPVEVTSLPATCSAQRPWVHGDGKCESALGESCANSEDCRCNGGTQCVQEGERAQCLSSCNFWAESCGAGTHCGRLFESGFLGSPYCFPDGPLGRDALCSRDSECASGLFCLRRQGVPQSEAGVCAPKCGAGLTCAQGDRCVPEKNSPFVDDVPPAGCLRGCDPWTSGSCSASAPELKCFATEDLDVGVCRPQTAALPGLGEGCERVPFSNEPTCQETLQCLSFGSRPSICAERCTTNADCSGGKLCNYTLQSQQGTWKFCI